VPDPAAPLDAAEPVPPVAGTAGEAVGALPDASLIAGWSDQRSNAAAPIRINAKTTARATRGRDIEPVPYAFARIRGRS
jgi:hypothetical protein